MPGRGEWDLIEKLGRLPQDFPDSVEEAIGEDCVLFDPRFAHRLALSTDLLVEEVHFRCSWIPPAWLGRRALAVSLSDLAAVGATPYASTLGLGLPRERTGEYFDAFLCGFLEGSRCWKSPLVGGDLSLSSNILISVTVWGWLPEGVQACRRSGARPGDRIMLAGRVGWSRLGLEMLKLETWGDLSQLETREDLERRLTDPEDLDCLWAHLCPEPLLAAGAFLAKEGLATAMIDVSDGLALDLYRLALAAGVEAEIDLSRLPLPPRRVAEWSPLEAALEGGEDYALLFTAGAEQAEQLEKSWPEGFPPVRMIGMMRESPPALYLRDAQGRSHYTPRGHDHFR